MPIVEFFFDIISPFSRIQYDLLMRQLGHWKSMEQLKMTPVLIRKVFEAAENLPPGMNPKKAVYLFNDLKLVSDYHKIPFALPDNFMQIAFEPGTNKTQQFLLALQQQMDSDNFNKLVGKFFLDFFHPTEHVNLTEVSEMIKVAKNFGISEDLIQKAVDSIETEPMKKKLEANNQRCIDLGAFGLPVTSVRESESDPDSDARWVFGSDRMHILQMFLKETKPPILQ